MEGATTKCPVNPRKCPEVSSQPTKTFQSRSGGSSVSGMLSLLVHSALFFLFSTTGVIAAPLRFVKCSHQPLGKRTLASYSWAALRAPRMLVRRQQQPQGHDQQLMAPLLTKTLDMETDLALMKQTTLPMAVMNLIQSCTGAGCVCLSSIASSTGTGLGSSLGIYLRSEEHTSELQSP